MDIKQGCFSGCARTSKMHRNSMISDLPNTDGHNMHSHQGICKDMLQNLVRLKRNKSDLPLVLFLVVVFSSVLSGKTPFDKMLSGKWK